MGREGLGTGVGDWVLGLGPSMNSDMNYACSVRQIVLLDVFNHLFLCKIKEIYTENLKTLSL